MHVTVLPPAAAGAAAHTRLQEALDALNPDLYRWLATRVSGDESWGQRIVDAMVAFHSACAAHPGERMHPPRPVDQCQRILMQKFPDRFREYSVTLGQGLITCGEYQPPISYAEALQHLGATADAVRAFGFEVDQGVWQEPSMAWTMLRQSSARPYSTGQPDSRWWLQHL